MDEMKIKAIVPYYGGKRSLAPEIVKLIDSHKSYWEPFCGSMAVLFAKPMCSMETVNDLHGDLINLARVIQDRKLGEQLYDKLLRTLCAERFFRESKERWISGECIEGKLDIERAYDYMVASWMGLNGVSGTERCNYAFALRWTTGGGHGAIRWKNTIESMPAWHKRLKNVVIIQRDAFEVVANIADEDRTVIYCDPPYVEASDKYIHDFDTEAHGRLAELLGRFKNAKVIVSYYDHPDLDPLYAGWEKVKMPKTRQSLRNATRGKKKKPTADRIEVLFVNKKVEIEVEEPGLF